MPEKTTGGKKAAGKENDEATADARQHKARAKPVLTPEEKVAIDLSRDKKAKNPRFRRQEWFRYKRVGTEWRKPRGLHSKMRRHISYRPKVVSEGFRTPKAARGRHPSGFIEVMVHNLNDMEGLDPKRQAIRIAHSVGYLKRMLIALRAEELGLRILNFSRQTHEELLEEAKKRGITLPQKGEKAGKQPAKKAQKKKAAKQPADEAAPKEAGE